MGTSQAKPAGLDTNLLGHRESDARSSSGFALSRTRDVLLLGDEAVDLRVHWPSHQPYFFFVFRNSVATVESNKISESTYVMLERVSGHK